MYIDGSEITVERTQDEIDNLKINWIHDPCWDLADTEGVEYHREELQAFEDKKNAEWEQIAQKKKEETIKKLKEKYKDDVWEYIYYLEQKLDNIIKEEMSHITLLSKELLEL